MDDKSKVFAAALPFSHFEGEQEEIAVFGGEQVLDPSGHVYRWGEPQNREIAACTFKIDTKYWELLGKPNPMVVGITNGGRFAWYDELGKHKGLLMEEDK